MINKIVVIENYGVHKKIIMVYNIHRISSIKRRGVHFLGCFELRRLFEGGVFSRTAFINLSTIMSIVN